MHYFQIKEPEALYPQLALRKPEQWHRSWQKHRKAYELEMAVDSLESAKSEGEEKPVAPAKKKVRRNVWDEEIDEPEEENQEAIGEKKTPGKDDASSK